MYMLTLLSPAETQPSLPNTPLRVIGIDLGTTNCAIAEIVYRPGETETPQIACLEVEQPTREGPYTHTLVPSVVALHDGQLYVGEGAKNLRSLIGDFKLEQNKHIFWDCKNDIGVRRTYHKAPEGFQSAKAISGHLLKFLAAAAVAHDPTPIARIVVAAPASFQSGQRRDTVGAAALAGLELGEGELLDEPIAAFLDYLATHGAQALGGISESQVLAVFDFGGGTCDVALFRLLPPEKGQTLRIAPLTVSRYHRLGGGDIDRAIVVEVLIPELLQQNNLSAHALDFNAKDKFVIPALLGVAEALKIGLCREITRLKRFGNYTEEKRATLIQKNPGVYFCPLPDGSKLRLQSPTLSALEFDKLLQPFLDRDFLYARETEYNLTCSIFAPLHDALDRAGLSPEDIGLCLMVGGSCLLPQIIDEVAAFFSQARLLHVQDAETTQTTVARGAAWQALSLTLCGRGIIQPVANDSIRIQTRSSSVELISSGTALPYPSDGSWIENERLVIPKTGLAKAIPVRLELRDSKDTVLYEYIWDIDPPVNRGDPLLLRYRMDANQLLDMELELVDNPERRIELNIENPLTNVVNPNAKRDRIAFLEEQMRTKAIPAAEQKTTVQEIALLHADLGQYDKALSLLKSLLRTGPNLNILNRMGIISGQKGDTELQERCYREAATQFRASVPLFNLALAQWRQGKLQEAMQTIDSAIDLDNDPPYLVLKAQLADKLKQPQQRDALLEQAFVMFEPPQTLDDWALGWYLTGAKLAGDHQRQKQALQEQQRRQDAGHRDSNTEGGILLDVRSEIAKR